MSKLFWKEHPAVHILSRVLDLEHNCGYLSFANIGVPDFGYPNLDPILRLGSNNSTHIHNLGKCTICYRDYILRKNRIKLISLY